MTGRNNGAMRGRWRYLQAPALAASVFLLAACTSDAPFPSAAATDPVAFDRVAALATVNAFRSGNGLNALTFNPALNEAANAQSEAMASRRTMDHFVNGALPTRIGRYGYQFTTASENIAYGQADFDAAMLGWERSEGHRRNLLDPHVTEIGLAATRDRETGRIYWTQIFGRPRPAEPTGPGTVMTLGGWRIPSR